MEKLCQNFTAADENGNEYLLRVYQKYISVPTRGNPSGVAPVKRRIVTEDGEEVNRLDKGKYQIVGTGAILRSSDPDAP